MRNGRVIVVIILLLVAFISYSFSKVYAYTLKTEQQALEADIAKLQVELDDLEVKMNMLSSKESVLDSNPNLKYNSNVYYLEPYE